MSNEKAAGDGKVSRRDFINIAAVGSGALMAVALSDSAFAAPKKFSQQQAHYQPTPKSSQSCQTCKLWQPPAACLQVEGQISPQGWCILFVKK